MESNNPDPERPGTSQVRLPGKESPLPVKYDTILVSSVMNVPLTSKTTWDYDRRRRKNFSSENPSKS